ncbi:hypothetical protein SAMN02745866_02204 [Alteromonadaceae bacterium Bs31]|nr:hypothetical protein SAMN02745866_02204 [Alteromonadaceae bacterium Bs31]
MIIPPEKLTEEVLKALVEAYIMREGTDYGYTELSLEDKVELLLPKVFTGEVLICYDEESETVNLLNKSDHHTMAGSL